MLILLLGAVSSSAYASDFTGFLSAVYTIVVTSISTIVNICLIISFQVSQKYKSTSFTRNHVLIALIIPIIGILLSFADHKTKSDLLYSVGFNFIAILIAVSPFFIRKLTSVNTNKQTMHIGKKTLMLSGVFAVLSIFGLAILAIPAIITSHIAINNNQGTLLNVSIGIAISSYISLIYFVSIILISS